MLTREQLISESRAIPAFGNGLAISDIVIGEMTGGEGLRRGSTKVTPLPGHRVAADSIFRMYYEVYGVRQADSIRTRVTMAPVSSGGLLAKLKAVFGERRVLDFAFVEQSQPDASGVVGVERSLKAAMEPGRYQLSVAVMRGSDTVSALTRLVLVDDPHW